MKLKSIIIGIIGLLLLLFIGTDSYYGGFTKISPEIQKCGGETVVYEKMTGDYAQSRTISDRVYQKLIDSHGITTTKGFSIYYDNPKTEKKKICVPMLGVILEYDFDKLETWKDDFEVTEYPISEYLVVEFSYKGMSSVILGIMKVYLAFETYVEENSFESDIPVMEIWDSAQ